MGFGGQSGRGHLKDPRAWKGPGKPKPSEFPEKWRAMNALQRLALVAGGLALVVGFAGGRVLPVALAGVAVGLGLLYFPENGRVRTFGPPALVVLSLPFAFVVDLAAGVLPSARALAVMVLALVHAAGALAGGRLAAERARQDTS